MSIEVFMQVWCLQKSKLWWKKRKKGENSGHWFCCHFGTYFGALSLVHFIHNTYHFESREVRSPKLQTVSKSELTKKLWSLQENCAELNEKFAPCESRCENFRTVRNTSWHTSAISHTSSPFSHRAKQGAKISHSAKLSAKCETRCEFLSPKYGNFVRCNSRSEILILRCENFATIGYVFGALLGAQIIHMICRFKA